MNLSAVLCDMDGTLANTNPMWEAAELEVMKRYGHTWTQEEQDALVGGSWRSGVTGMAKLVGENPQILSDTLMDAIELMAETTQITEIPGARNFAEMVKSAGIPFLVVSNSPRRLVNLALAHIGVECDGIIIGDEVMRPKPWPDPYVHAATSLGLDPRDCVAVEDSQSGVIAGVSAGCRVVAVPRGNQIETDHPLLVVKSLENVTVQRLERYASQATVPAMRTHLGVAGESQRTASAAHAPIS